MKKELFNELLTSVKEGGNIVRGKTHASRTFLFDQPDVSAIREHFGVTQEKFALMLGISVSTLRNWEQGRRKPDGAACVLLNVAAKYPEAVLDVVSKAA